MVRYIGRSTSDTLNPGADFFKFAITPQVGVVQVPHDGVLGDAVVKRHGSLRVASGATIRLVLRTGIPLQRCGKVQRCPPDADLERPFRDSAILCRCLKFISTNEEDVFPDVRSGTESLRVNVDLTLHGEEGRPLSSHIPPPRNQVTLTRPDGYGQVSATR